MDFDIHLDRRDAVMRAGHLEIHVAEEVLEALDVGQQDEIIVRVAGHEAAADTGNLLLDRNTGIHQRHAGRAGGSHGG